MKTEKKRLFFNIFFGYLLLSLICAGIVFGSKTYAATPSCNDTTICAVVKLSGTIPSNITLKATAINSLYLQHVNSDGWYKTYTLSKISNDTYFLKAIDPYNQDHVLSAQNCIAGVLPGIPNPNPMFTFSFSVTGDSSPVSKRQDLVCGTNSISINLGSTSPSEGTTTPPTSKASLTGRIIVKTASDEVYACTPSIYTNALTGSYGPNFHLITLNPGNFTLDAIDSGSISFPNVNSGPTTMKGQVDPCNATDQRVNIPRFSVNFNLNAGSNIKFFIIDTTNNNHVTISATDPLAFNNEPPTCVSTGGALAWITCKLVDGLAKGEAALESAVISMLVSPSLDLQNGTSNCNANATNNTNNITGQEVANSCIFQAWSNFRIYGDIFLVIALLVAVIVEAMGGGLISNYTIKKMLPRIIVAVILINLSIYIVAILEDIFNVLGAGIYDLISAPFQAAGQWKLNIKNTTGSDTFLGIFGGLSLVAGGLALGGIWHGLKTNTGTGVKAKAGSVLSGLGDAAAYIVMFIVIPVVLAVLGVVLTLLFRQAILILLLMISPVAFALYCLPNTEQYFKKWWDLLIKTLWVYPIVIAIFCMAEVMAIIFSNNPFGLEDFLSKIMAMIAVGAPLFLIPFAFRISGGVMGGVHGGIGKVGKRLNSAYRGDAKDPNSRQNKVKRRMQYRQEQYGVTGGAMARRAQGMLGTRGGIRDRIRGGSTRADDRFAGVDLAHATEELSNNKTVQANQNNSKFWEAVANEDSAKAKRDHQQSVADDTTRSATERAVARNEVAAWDSSIAASKSVKKTRGAIDVASTKLAEDGTSFSEGQAGHNEMMDLAARSTGATVQRDASGNAVGFEGPSAGRAMMKLSSMKSSLAPKRADLTGNLGSTRYNPTAPDSAWDRQDFAAKAAQRVETHRSINSHVEGLAHTATTQQEFETIAQHMAQLEAFSSGGHVPPAVAAEAQRSLQVLQSTTSGGFAAWYTDPANAGAVDAARNRASKPLV
jgi:hypothetical protein